MTGRHTPSSSTLCCRPVVKQATCKSRITGAEEQRQGKLRRQVTGSKSTAKYTFQDIVGSSKKLAECKAIAQRMARSNSNILITGATGVGKELFAQSIHNASARKNQPFIAVNCGALVESLLESELFGYEKAPLQAPTRTESRAFLS